MMKRTLLIAAAVLGLAAPAFAAGETPVPPIQKWSFAGPFGTFDRAQLQRELSPGGVPASLLPALRAATQGVTKRRGQQLQVTLSPRGVRLALPSGETFAQARTLLQARVRALALAQALWGFVPDAWLTGPQWKKVAQRLGGERPRPTLLLGTPGTIVLELKMLPAAENELCSW